MVAVDRHLGSLCARLDHQRRVFGGTWYLSLCKIWFEST